MGKRVKEKNNSKGVIILLVIVIIVLGVLCTLFATDTISLKKNVNSSNEANDNQLETNEDNSNYEIQNNYILKIEDVSCKCIPNGVYFYDNNTFITKGMNNKTIEKGKYNYDINKIIKNINTYTSDNKTYMNYRITLPNGEEYLVKKGTSELEELLNPLNITWH